MKDMVFYRCELCGNMVAMIRKGGGTLTCCGQEMTELTANTTDAAKEKHVPEVVREDGKVKVQVGSVMHPSLVEHHIEWIALAADGKFQMQYIGPGVEPRADFEDAESGTVYEYCNLHGLWKADF